MSYIDNPGTSGGGGSGTVTVVAGGVGITNIPEPIIGAGSVNLDIDSLTAESVLAAGDEFAFVDVSAGGSAIANQRKITFADLVNDLAASGVAMLATCASAPELLCRGGRTGATNNFIVSSDADGRGQGSAAAGKAFHLFGDGTAAGVHISTTALGDERVIIGQNIDPTDALVPGGVLQFLVAPSTDTARFGAASAGVAEDSAPTFFGIRSQGTLAAPTETLDNNALLLFLGGAYDTNDTLVVGGAVFAIEQDDVAHSGYFAGRFTWVTTDTTGTAALRLIIKNDGKIGVNTGPTPSTVLPSLFNVMDGNLTVEGFGIFGSFDVPQAALHVVGVKELLQEASADTGSALNFMRDDGAEFRLIGAVPTGSADEYDIFLGQSTASTRYFLFANLFTGLGTTTPLSLFHVDGGDIRVTNGNIMLGTVGGEFQVKEGTNASMGRAVLVGGTVVVSNTLVTATSEIFVTSQVDGGAPGAVRVSARTAGTSFTITSLSALDTSTVAWIIVEPAP